jgi:outer membrane protein OmpA-like peptidoglycan-associated protein
MDMKRSRLLWMGAAALLLSACYSAPVRMPVLDDARAAVEAARANPQVTTYAADELQVAVSTYERAQALLRSGADADEVRHVSYLAQQRAAIAQETARLRYAEQSIGAATAERERARLEASAREAAAAVRSAHLAEARAESAERAAREAQAQARGAQRQAILTQPPAQPSAQPPAAPAAERRANFEKELRELAATKSDRGIVVTLNDVLFDPGSSMLRPGGQRLVARLGDFLREYPDRTIAIEGFTDSAPTDALSIELSERRAAAVRVALVEEGVDASRVFVRGYGKAFPVATNDTPEGRQRNRRVEIVISEEGGAIAPRIASYGGR